MFSFEKIRPFNRLQKQNPEKIVSKIGNGYNLCFFGKGETKISKTPTFISKHNFISLPFNKFGER